MILDNGLDNMATVTASTSSGNPRIRWNHHAAIGTGTGAPAEGQTALDSETHRTTSRGGFNFTETWTRHVASDMMRYELEEVRVFAFEASFNLTEFGFSPTSGPGDLNFRDLFREDPNNPASDPVVITVGDGDELHLWYTWTYELPWLTAPESFTITGAPGKDSDGVYDGDATFFATGDGSPAQQAIEQGWPGGFSTNRIHVVVNESPSSARNEGISSVGGAVASLSADTYTAGTFERTWRATFGTSAAVAEHTAWVRSVFSSTTNLSGGYKFVLTDPATLDKADTHELELEFTVEWDRAGS